MTVGEKIRVLREDCNLSLEEFASRLGVELIILEKWESDIIQPTNDEIQKVVDLVKEIRQENESKPTEEVSKPIEETKKEEVVITGGKGPVLGTCVLCGHEVHKYDKYTQYKKHKKDVFVCDECDKERRKDPKFRRILRLINWLTYSTYLYIAVALCCMIIYFVEKIDALIFTDIALAFVILAQIITSYFIMRKNNI